MNDAVDIFAELLLKSIGKYDWSDSDKKAFEDDLREMAALAKRLAERCSK